MAAKGSQSKEVITQKLLETFDGAFINGKEIRIPMLEGGERIEIKVTLTCAKECVGTPEIKQIVEERTEFPPTKVEKAPIEPSEEEKQRVVSMMAKLGIPTN